MSLLAGTKLGPYEIVAPLGAGGMGEVYRARDGRLGREVALKVLPSSTLTDATARARLLREARLASQLNHPNVCTIHEVGEADGQAYIAMELVEGETLRERLSKGAFSSDEVLRIGQQLADGLAHAHEHGVIHRDLKSANIVITPEGRVKILDFGLARRLTASDLTEASTMTAAGTVTGTLAYMAPELLLGRQGDNRSDLWALGVVLYEMATGLRPFQERLSTALIEEIIHREPLPPGRIRPGLSPRIEGIILKCLAKEPGSRYASARELLEDLRRLGQPESVREPLGHAVRSRRPAVLGLLIALAILGLGSAGYLAWKHRVSPVASSRSRVMLAVLPVENLSRDPEQEYFSDGLTEELIAQLGGLKPARLGVIARTSAMSYKRTQKTVDQIGRELGVDYVLESSVRKEAGRVRITTQLIQVRDQTHLWAESYERDLSGILALQSEVSERVARSLAIELLPSERARLAGARPVNPEAYELCLKGRHHWNLRTAKDLLKATEYFRAATAADPSFALAWAGLGDSYALYPFYDVLGSRASFPQARTAAEKALALDPALIEAETTLAFVTFYYDWDWAGTETGLKRVLERRPDYAIARQWYAEYLTAMGRHDEALREIRRARESDPLSPIHRAMEGWVLYYARRYEEALESLRKVQPLEPDYPLVYDISAITYRAMGRYPEALGAYAQADKLEGAGGWEDVGIAAVLAASGKRDEARKLLAAGPGPGRRGQPQGPYDMALLHAALASNDEAMVWLERAYDEREANLVFAKVNPRLDPLRADPRFQRLLGRMNFPSG
jgi:serine/threonine protein kinase/tetratricopeptide (TPR) repeat protein